MQAAMRFDLLFYAIIYLLLVFIVGFVAACFESSVKHREKKTRGS